VPRQSNAQRLNHRDGSSPCRCAASSRPSSGRCASRARSSSATCVQPRSPAAPAAGPPRPASPHALLLASVEGPERLSWRPLTQRLAVVGDRCAGRRPGGVPLPYGPAQACAAGHLLHGGAGAEGGARGPDGVRVHGLMMGALMITHAPRTRPVHTDMHDGQIAAISASICSYPCCFWYRVASHGVCLEEPTV
jgi:hypothetical protein